MKTVLPLIIFILISSLAIAQQQYKGKVLSTMDQSPLVGASISVKNSNYRTITNDKGEFQITVPTGFSKIEVSHVGYIKTSVDISMEDTNNLVIQLEPDQNQLEEVFVSTGYQTLPKERVTGSFVNVSNDIIERTVSTNWIERLDGVVPGLIFNRDAVAGENNISIRGQSTINANTSPLIVLDNFPYEGDINNINPADIQNITVLKDAAAASIWGARAANGVIVITTKRGQYNRPLHISFNSSVSLREKPDVLYKPVMSSADYIQTERLLFEKGYYKTFETSLRRDQLSPVVEWLIAARDGLMTPTEADKKIESLKGHHVNEDFDKYYYQNNLNRKYSLTLDGGTQHHSYYLSAGYDKNRENLVYNSSERLNVNAVNKFGFVNNKLEVETGVHFSKLSSSHPNSGPSAVTSTADGFIYPYARLADNNGNPRSITRRYRRSFILEAERRGLLNWEYRPLEELGVIDNTSKSTEYRLETAISYKPFPFLRFTTKYQFSESNMNYQKIQGLETFYARDKINNYTQVEDDGTLKQIIPEGSILDGQNGTSQRHHFRGQADFDKRFGSLHVLTAIAGFEVSNHNIQNQSYRLYGYDKIHAISQPVDYVKPYPMYYNTATSTAIPNNDEEKKLTDRYVSYFTNAAYTYEDKYTLTASARLDRSNLFGVRANQKGVPLYSLGLAWDISKERFFNSESIQDLRFRLTYGYNGNVDKSTSAYTTAYYYGITRDTRLPYSNVVNPPNPDLRWERVRVINAAVDFNIFKGRVSGTVEYYKKRATDLIGVSTVARSLGVSNITSNYASLKGNGVDLTLKTRNIDNIFKWTSTVNLSTVHTNVTDYRWDVQPMSYVTSLYKGTPIKDEPMYAFYSFKWAGLDPETGDPLGYLGDELSKAYSEIQDSASPDNLVYHGNARPRIFGNVLNTFSWKQFNLSFNLSYRLKYYFRPSTVSYRNVLMAKGQHADFGRRWQKPGDEQFTDVPSLPADIDKDRDAFYAFSEVLAEKGDHIRFQDIRLGYSINPQDGSRLPFKSLHFYLYASDLGILWKATNKDIDPNYVGVASIPIGRQVAFGVKINL